MIEIPGYRLAERIGKGGFSSVYRADDLRHGRSVAVKVLDADLDIDNDGGSAPSTSRDTFVQECKMMGRLSQHPHIVPIFDSGFAPSGEPFLVMPRYIRGTCEQRLAVEGPFEVEEVLAVGVEVASALDAAHKSGVIHRDVKPANVFITDFGRWVLGDFGISAFAQTDQRPGASTNAAFTPAHAAPEVLHQVGAVAASDLYSLGSLLYTLLAGHGPFTSNDVGSTMVKSVTEEPPPISRADLPLDLEELLWQLLAKDPELRPPNGAFVARRLQQIQEATGFSVTQFATALPDETPLAAEPLAAPDSRAALEEGSRRRAKLLGAAAVLMAGLILGVIWGFGAAGNDADDPPDTTVPPATSNVVLPLPAPPVTVLSQYLDEQTVEFTWPAAVVGTATWEVKRLDRDSNSITQVGEPLLQIGDLGPDEVPCVEITTIFDRLASSPSQPHCATR